MKFREPLNQNTFLLYATKMYDNPQSVGVTEFNEDIKILSYIKRVLSRYNNSGKITERLLLNHIVSLANLFDNEPTVRLCFFYCPENTHPALISAFSYLGILSDNVPELNININESDKNIDKLLQEI